MVTYLRKIFKTPFVFTLLSSLVLFAMFPQMTQAVYTWKNPTYCYGNFTPCGNAYSDGGNYADGSDNQFDFWSRYFNPFVDPEGMVVQQVAIRVDAWKSDPNANAHLFVIVTAIDENDVEHEGYLRDITLSSSQTSYTFDVTDEIDWNPYMLELTNVKVNVRCEVYSGTGNCNVDWVPLSATFAYL